MASSASGSVLDELRSDEQVDLMDAIDALRSQALSEKLHLPQIIVCGNQSSGKSSVLAAISGFSFASGDGLTTKFVTEIALRSGRDGQKEVTIEPGPETTANDREFLRSSSEELQTILTTTDDLSAVLARATSVIESMPRQSDFSPHRIRIQLSGQHCPNLTLIDLPGLIATTLDETRKDDIRIVRNLVEVYMQQQRSIILAVAPASSDPETQIVFELVKKIDPHGCRTMGILTMPDRVQRGAEQKFVDLVKNEKIKLDLGWHVIKNLNTEEAQTRSRDSLEQDFFANPESPWNVVPAAHRGIKTLRTKLGDLSFQHICSSLPDLIREIDGNVRRCESHLQALGPARESHNERLRYLEKVCNNLSALVTQAIDGSYDNRFFDGGNGHADDARFMRTELRKLYDDFATKMAQSGNQYHVVSNAETATCAIHERTIRTTSFVLGPSGPPQCVTAAVMMESITAYVAKYRGRELPHEMPERATRDVFRMLSAPWEHLGQSFASRCLDTARRFYGLALHNTASTAAGVIIDELLSYQFRDMEAKLSAKVAEVLSPFQSLTPFTKNPTFEAQMIRYYNDVLLCRDLSHPDAMAAATKLSTIMALYHVSEGTFIDNMIMLVVENCVVEPLRTMFTTQTVLELEQTDVGKFDRIASESRAVMVERDSLQEQLRCYRKGRHTCNKYVFYQAGRNERATDIPASHIHSQPEMPHAHDSTPGIRTPDPRDEANLHATQGDPATFTPPRTPDHKPRSTSSQAGERSPSIHGYVPSFARPGVSLFGSRSGKPIDLAPDSVDGL